MLRRWQVASGASARRLIRCRDGQVDAPHSQEEPFELDSDEVGSGESLAQELGGNVDGN